MNVHKALEGLCGEYKIGPSIVNIAIIEDLAPIIERALRASAQEMAALLAHELQTGARGNAKELLAVCITAGVAAMMEES